MKKLQGDIKKHLDAFRKRMEANFNSERAIQEKRYLKSPFKFFGTSLPFADKLAKEFRRTNKDAGRELVFELAERLWSSEYHDEKRLGLRILQYHPEYLDLTVMPLLERMLEQSRGWDLVDDISIHIVSVVLEKDKKAFEYLKRWSKSEIFWMRRASLISQILLFRKNEGDKKLFFDFAERMVSEKEFFIRKAIGWGIREMSKADPDEAFNFLMKIKDRASGLTLREGAKRLPAHQRVVLNIKK
ncbi:MAG: DNA alkylation repair protein [Nitrospirae bacterium]|nr:DNA alkylation repair protein [Nitrospirota bacterium]